MLIPHFFTQLIQSANNLFSKPAAPAPEGLTHQQQTLALLQLNGEVTTNDLREAGVNSPRARVKDLRDQGYCIITIRKKVASGNGKFSSVVFYTLN